MKDIIDTLRRENFKVTIHDIGTDKSEFVLAVFITELLDIWYLSRVMNDGVTIPKIVGPLMVFPDMRIDAQTYDYICA